MEVDGRGAFGFMGCLVVGAIAIVVVFGGLTLTSGIESSRADRAGAVALAEQAKAGAIIAEFEADVEKKEIETSHELAMAVERNEQQLKELYANNRIFQEKLLMLTVIVEGMDGKQVSRLERLLDGDSTWLSVALAAFLAVVVFLLLLALRRYINWKWEGLWTTHSSPK